MSEVTITKLNSLEIKKRTSGNNLNSILPADGTLVLGTVTNADIASNSIINNPKYDPNIDPVSGQNNYNIADGTIVYNSDQTIPMYFVDGTATAFSGGAGGLTSITSNAGSITVKTIGSSSNIELANNYLNPLQSLTSIGYPGILCQTNTGFPTNQYTTRSIISGDNNIVIQNGNGSGGNISLSLGNNLSFNRATIQNVDTTNAYAVANVGYVQTLAAGFTWLPSCVVASVPNDVDTGSLQNVNFNNGVLTAIANGQLTLDGISPPSTQRVLIKDYLLVNSPRNGTYTVTNPGSADTPWVLTRTADNLTAGSIVAITGGAANKNTNWFETNSITTLNTSPISFSQFGSNNTGTVTEVSGQDGQITVEGIANATPVIGLAPVKNENIGVTVSNATVTIDDYGRVVGLAAGQAGAGQLQLAEGQEAIAGYALTFSQDGNEPPYYVNSTQFTPFIIDPDIINRPGKTYQATQLLQFKNNAAADDGSPVVTAIGMETFVQTESKEDKLIQNKRQKYAVSAVSAVEASTLNPITLSNVGYINFSNSTNINTEGYITLDDLPCIVLQHNTAGSGSTAYTNSCAVFTGGNLGEGSSSPNAVLEVNTTTGGFLPPRLTQQQINALNVSSKDGGLIVYNTTTNSINMFNGITFVELAIINPNPTQLSGTAQLNGLSGVGVPANGVTSNSTIIVTPNLTGGVLSPLTAGSIRVGNIEPGIGFDVYSTVMGDTADFSWMVSNAVDGSTGNGHLAGTNGVQVSAPSVTANTYIFVTAETPQTPLNPVSLGTIRVGNIVPGTGFTVYSTVAGDTANFSWMMINTPSDLVGEGQLTGIVGTQVSAPAVTQNSCIFATPNLTGGVLSPLTAGSIRIGNVVPGTGFTVYSTVAGDTANFSWMIIN